MTNKRAVSGENLFVRALKYSLLRSLPFALIPAIAAIICIAIGVTDGNYLCIYLPACCVSVLCCIGASLLFAYNSFPCSKDGRASKICYALLLSGFISAFASLLFSFGFAAVCGGLASEGLAHNILYTLKSNFTALYISLVSAHFAVFTVFAALFLAVLYGKKKKKSVVSRTCRAAVPIFPLLTVYYSLMLMLFTYSDMSYAANLASEHFLNENAVWLVTVLIPISIIASSVLWLLCVRRAKKTVLEK